MAIGLYGLDWGDTAKVDRTLINLGWQKRTPEYEYNETTKQRVRSGYKNVNGIAQLFWRAQIIDYFGIPEYEIDLSSLSNLNNNFASQGAAGTSTYYNDLTQSAVTTTVARKGATKLDTESKGTNGVTVLSVQVPLLESKKPNGQYRRVSLPFPRFFNLVMVAQALVQIFDGASKADRKPPYFWTKAGTQYLLPYQETIISTKGVIAPADCGAWLMTSAGDAPTINNNDDDPIPNAPVARGGSGRTKKATA